VPAFHQCFRSLAIFGIVSLSAGCIPRVQMRNEPCCKVSFAEEESGTQIHEVLVFQEHVDFLGWIGPEGIPDGLPDRPAGLMTHYFKLWTSDPQKPLTGPSSIAALGSLSLLTLIPTYYGGISYTQGLLIIAPGYRITYVPEGEIGSLNGDRIIVPMASAQHSEVEIARLRQWLKNGQATPAELATCAISRTEAYDFSLPRGAAYGFRLNLFEHQAVRTFLGGCADRAPATQPTPRSSALHTSAQSQNDNNRLPPASLIGTPIAATLLDPSPSGAELKLHCSWMKK
jgi:hypothetical protein